MSKQRELKVKCNTTPINATEPDMETFKKADITFMEGLRLLGMTEEEEPREGWGTPLVCDGQSKLQLQVRAEDGTVTVCDGELVGDEI